ncbi:MAG: hypothetical protein OXQ31_19375 [Spirochaetaceae bacterium]|nr:hypothetical protein [Spirochaetaceae bacterium]
MARVVLTRAGFLKELPSDQARDVAEQLMDVAERNGAELFWRSASVSVRVRCPLASPAREQPAQGRPAFVSVAWLVLPGRRALGGRLWGVSFGAFLGEKSAPRLKDRLSQWAEQFSTDDFAQFSTDFDFAKNAEGRAWSIAYDDAAQHIDLLAERLRQILVELKSL